MDRVHIFQDSKYLLAVDKKINYTTPEVTVINSMAFRLITRSFKYRKFRINNLRYRQEKATLKNKIIYISVIKGLSPFKHFIALCYEKFYALKVVMWDLENYER